MWCDKDVISAFFMSKNEWRLTRWSTDGAIIVLTEGGESKGKDRIRGLGFRPLSHPIKQRYGIRVLQVGTPWECDTYPVRANSCRATTKKAVAMFFYQKNKVILFIFWIQWSLVLSLILVVLSHILVVK